MEWRQGDTTGLAERRSGSNYNADGGEGGGRRNRGDRDGGIGGGAERGGGGAGGGGGGRGGGGARGGGSNISVALLAGDDGPDDADFANVPGKIIAYVTMLRNSFLASQVDDVHVLYEHTFRALSDRFFSGGSWPEWSQIVEAVESIESEEDIFGSLYKELYYRHLYGSGTPTLSQQVHSWNNYCDLFGLFLTDQLVEIALPPSWLWDMVDEFVYQTEAWCAFRTKLSKLSPDEVEYLRTNEDVWSVNAVLRYLHALVSKSNVCPWMLNGGVPSGSTDAAAEDFDLSTRSSYRYIGYYSIVGLLRVHTLVGDYRLALMVLQPLHLVDSAVTSLYTHVTACHISLFYYMGFCQCMLRRYEDAVRILSTTLSRVGRLKQFHTRSYQYEQINKRHDQMAALMALCLALHPQHVDQSLMAIVRDKAGERLARMRAGDVSSYEDTFGYTSPKFISPAPPVWDAGGDMSAAALSQQSALFLRDVRQQLQLPELRSYLKLYTTIGLDKLAHFMNADEAALRAHLLGLKHKAGGSRGATAGGPPLVTVTPAAMSTVAVGATVGTDGPVPAVADDGAPPSAADLAFYVDGNDVHVSGTVVETRYGEYFLEQVGKSTELLSSVKRRAAAAVGPPATASGAPVGGAPGRLTAAHAARAA